MKPYLSHWMLCLTIDAKDSGHIQVRRERDNGAVEFYYPGIDEAVLTLVPNDPNARIAIGGLIEQRMKRDLKRKPRAKVAERLFEAYEAISNAKVKVVIPKLKKTKKNKKSTANAPIDMSPAS